jgi:hypothetical protein
VSINVIIFISEHIVKFMEAKTTLFLFITMVNFNSEFTLAVHNVIADVFNMIMRQCKPWGIPQESFLLQSFCLQFSEGVRNQRRWTDSLLGSSAPGCPLFL